MTQKYLDIINPKQVDERSGAEIVADVIKAAGLEVVS